MAALKEHVVWSGRQALNGVQMQVFHVGRRQWGDLPPEVIAELILGSTFPPFLPLLCSWCGMLFPPPRECWILTASRTDAWGLRQRLARLRWARWRAAAGSRARPPGSPLDSVRPAGQFLF